MTEQHIAGVERRLLGILLNYLSRAEEHAAELDPIQLSDPRHRIVLGAIQQLCANGLPDYAGLAEVIHELEKSGRIAKAGGRDYVLSLLDEPGVLQPSALPALKAEVRRSHRARVEGASLSELAARVADGRLDGQGALTQLEAVLDSLGSESADDAWEWDAAELMNANLPAFQWLVSGLVPQYGITTMSAFSRVGKSLLAMQLMLSVVGAERYLEHKVVHSGPIIYVAYEGSDEMIRDWLHRQSSALGVSEEQLRGRLIVITRPKDEERHIRIGSGIGWAYLIRRIKELQPSMVVFDTLSDVAPSDIDFDSYADVSARIKTPLLSLVRRFGCHLVAIHHSGKAASQPKGEQADQNAILGSVQLAGMADNTIVARYLDESQGIIEAKFRPRGGLMTVMKLQRDPEGLIYRALEVNGQPTGEEQRSVGAGSAAANGRGRIELSDLTKVAQSDGSLTIAAVQEALVVNRDKAKAALEDFHKSGDLAMQKVGGKNIYKLARIELDPYNGNDPF